MDKIVKYLLLAFSYLIIQSYELRNIFLLIFSDAKTDQTGLFQLTHAVFMLHFPQFRIIHKTGRVTVPAETTVQQEHDKQKYDAVDSHGLTTMLSIRRVVP